MEFDIRLFIVCLVVILLLLAGPGKKTEAHTPCEDECYYQRQCDTQGQCEYIYVCDMS